MPNSSSSCRSIFSPEMTIGIETSTPTAVVCSAWDIDAITSFITEAMSAAAKSIWLNPAHKPVTVPRMPRLTAVFARPKLSQRW